MMIARLRSWRQKIRSRLHWLGRKIKQHPRATGGIIIAGTLGTALVVVIVLGYWLNWDWIGLGPYAPPKGSNFQRGKTFWDWLQLLIIPFVLAVGGYLFNLTVSRNEQKSIHLRDQTEREIASDNQREAALQAYIDKMSELLLHEKLRGSAEEDEVRKIARVRTLTLLPRLDANRKKSVLQFLYESGLINVDEQMIDLVGADLSEANLLTANLSEADLSGVNLQGALLMGAKLNGANLSKTVLNKANLVGADLSKADLCAAAMREVDLNGANLRKANLRGADLSEANFSKTMHKENISDTQTSTILHSLGFIISTLPENGLVAFVVKALSSSERNLTFTFKNGANLSEANLSGANLSEANLSGANLSGTNLSGANLIASYVYNEYGVVIPQRGANLSEANLSGATITQEQLSQAKSLKGATMPDGSIHS